MWKIVFWLILPLLIVSLWASYTWQKSIHKGPFLHFLGSRPEIISQDSMEPANEALVAQIKKLARPEIITHYLESIGFTCKPYFGQTPPGQAALGTAVSSPFCFFEYGMFGRTHEWRVGYDVLKDDTVQYVQTNQICLICP